MNINSLLIAALFTTISKKCFHIIVICINHNLVLIRISKSLKDFTHSYFHNLVTEEPTKGSTLITISCVAEACAPWNGKSRNEKRFFSRLKRVHRPEGKIKGGDQVLAREGDSFRALTSARSKASHPRTIRPIEG